MRCMWIATGVIAVVLALAAALKPGQRGGAGFGDSPDVPASEPTQATPPRTLAAEDLDRIMALRAEIGSAAGLLGDEKIAAAAFERELRQLAGLGESPEAPTETTLAHQRETGSAKGPRGHREASPAVLRQAAAALDDAADRAEDAGDYDGADALRELSGELRRQARQAALRADQSLPLEGAPAALIDNNPAPQAQ